MVKNLTWTWVGVTFYNFSSIASAGSIMCFIHQFRSCICSSSSSTRFCTVPFDPINPLTIDWTMHSVAFFFYWSVSFTQCIIFFFCFFRSRFYSWTTSACFRAFSNLPIIPFTISRGSYDEVYCYFILLLLI